VTPTIDMAAFREELESYDFGKPRPLEELLRWTLERMERGIVQMANPRYFGLSTPAQAFRRSVPIASPACSIRSSASSASSPVPVELERHVIRAVARRAALGDEATGHFATGGSEANYTALLSALTGAHPEFATDGARALHRPGEVLYVTRLSHSLAESRAPDGSRPVAGCVSSIPTAGAAWTRGR